LREAELLQREDSLTVTELAAALGYAEHAHFTRDCDGHVCAAQHFDELTPRSHLVLDGARSTIGVRIGSPSLRCRTEL